MHGIVYGEIRDKYPKNLLTHHHILSAKSTAMRREIDQVKWDAAVKEMGKYEYSSGDFMIVTPKTREDILPEKKRKPEKVIIAMRRKPPGLPGGGSRFSFLKILSRFIDYGTKTSPVLCVTMLHSLDGKYFFSPTPYHLVPFDCWAARIYCLPL